MSALSPPPTYIYKILPNTPPYQGTPIPIPSDYPLPKTQVDLTDGFVHLSTSRQLPHTLTRFFSSNENQENEKGVQLVKVDYDRLSKWKIVKWEKGGNRSGGEVFPHLYAELEGQFVVAVKVVKRNVEGEGKEESWEDVVRKLRDEGWLED